MYKIPLTKHQCNLNDCHNYQGMKLDLDHYEAECIRLKDEVERLTKLTKEDINETPTTEE